MEKLLQVSTNTELKQQKLVLMTVTTISYNVWERIIWALRLSTSLEKKWLDKINISSF